MQILFADDDLVMKMEKEQRETEWEIDARWERERG